MSCSDIARSSSGGISERVEADIEMTSLRRITCCCDGAVAEGQAVGRFRFQAPDQRPPVASLDHVGLITGADLVVGDQHVQQDGIGWLVADAAQIRSRRCPPAAVDGVARRAVRGEHLPAADGIPGPSAAPSPASARRPACDRRTRRRRRARGHGPGSRRRDDSSGGCAATAPARCGASAPRSTASSSTAICWSSATSADSTASRSCGVNACQRLGSTRRDAAARSRSCTVALHRGDLHIRGMLRGEQARERFSSRRIVGMAEQPDCGQPLIDAAALPSSASADAARQHGIHPRSGRAWTSGASPVSSVMNAERLSEPSPLARSPCAMPRSAAGCQPNSADGSAICAIRSRHRSGISPAPNS